MAKDVDLFKAAMAGVSPLKGRRRSAGPTASRSVVEGQAAKKDMAAAPVAREGSAMRARLAEGGGLIFDRTVDRALARGRRAPEAKLDLHGMTLAAAERAVAHFLAEAADQGRRVVLIVTGKGLRLEGGRMFGGRIRSEFPGWLERPDNRARVAGVRPAHPRHGGSGAFYVLLRRRTVRA